jgi:hypothetical protein
VGIGVVVEVAFLAYAVLLGRAAAARGETGAIGEHDRSWARVEPLQAAEPLQAGEPLQSAEPLQAAGGLHPQVGVG